MYTPRTNKHISPHTMAAFTQKAEKLPKDDRQQKRDKFRLDMKNAMSLPAGVKFNSKKK